MHLLGAHPAVSDKAVYAGTKDGIVAVERGGDSVIWRNDVGISSVNPVIADNAVVGTQNLILHRFDPESGDENPCIICEIIRAEDRIQMFLPLLVELCILRVKIPYMR